MFFDYAQDVFVYSVVLLVHLILAVDSLKYHVTKYESTREKIQVFLENISTPLKLLFSPKPHFNAYTTHQVLDVVEYLAENKHQYYRRLIYAAIPFFIVLTNARALSLSQDVPQSLLQSVFLVINCYCFYRAWRFGHKLKDIEVTQE